MKYRKRIHYSDSQKSQMWERWHRGESLQQIAQLFDRNHSSIQRTQDPAGAAIEDVGIDLGRGDIPVSEQLLDGPDVIAHFEQVGCERMPQGMRAQWLDDARTKTRRLQSTRQDGVVEVMTTLDAIVRIDRPLYGRKHVLPAEVTRCRWILACQCVWQGRCAKPCSQIGSMLHPRTFDFTLQRLDQRFRQYGVAILSSFSPRIVISLRAKSTSLTRRRRHSIRRMPVP
jgi:hypothetical protein